MTDTDEVGGSNNDIDGGAPYEFINPLSGLDFISQLLLVLLLVSLFL